MLTKQRLISALRQGAFFHADEISVFCRYAAEAQEKLLEIGAAWGASAVLMLLSAPETASVTSIDSFVPETHTDGRPWQATPETCDAAVRRALKELGKPEAYWRWRLCPMSSLEAAATWRAPLDFLYIDGDHSYEAVRADFDAWFPYVRSGGLILLHDSRRLPNEPGDHHARGFRGPTRLAEELLRDKRLHPIDEAFSLSIWRKL